MAKILLIDDDVSCLETLSMTLRHFGHTVVEAKNGKEGIDLFQYPGIDLVITDILMPEKEGLEVILELRHKHPTVKIIAISGGGPSHTPAAFLSIAKLMGTKVLAKPFSTEQLMTVISQLLPVSGSRAPFPVKLPDKATVKA